VLSGIIGDHSHRPREFTGAMVPRLGREKEMGYTRTVGFRITGFVAKRRIFFAIGGYPKTSNLRITQK
jgi:hypothetical protein